MSPSLPFRAIACCVALASPAAVHAQQSPQQAAAASEPARHDAQQSPQQALAASEPAHHDAEGTAGALAAIAKRVIRASADVQPGEVVVISGGKHTLELMEDLAIEAQRVGGLPQLLVSSDRVTRDYYTDVPARFLSQPPNCLATVIKNVPVWISLPAVEDEQAVFGDVPQERFAAVARGAAALNQALDRATRVRVVHLAYPSARGGAEYAMASDAYQRMQWEGMNADYGAISARGEALRRVLRGARRVHVTSPSGTDIVFSIGDRPVFLDGGVVSRSTARRRYLDRIASLPGGQVMVAPIETSANGTVVVPRSLCRFAPIVDQRFRLKAGRMEDHHAAEGGACFEAAMAPYRGPKDVFGYFSIGLNPVLDASRAETDYRPSSAAGMVYVAVGDNAILGGKNRVPRAGFAFPIVNATVTVDGKVVVKDGQLALLQ